MATFEYSGAHSITFGDGSLTSDGKFAGINTWTDWHLIPSSRPTMPMPGFNTKYVEIPGRDGSIDLSEFLVKRPVFGDRSGSFEFVVDHTREPDWISLYRRIATFLHGKNMKMCLADDPGYYYEGRFSLNEWASEQTWSRIVLNYQVGPYKIGLRMQGDEDIIWDTFNFNTDYHWFMAFNRCDVNGGVKTFSIPGSDYPYQIYAKLISGSVTVSFNGETITPVTDEFMSVGHATNNTGTLRVSGTGVVEMRFREGSL